MSLIVLCRGHLVDPSEVGPSRNENATTIVIGENDCAMETISGLEGINMIFAHSPSAFGPSFPRAANAIQAALTKGITIIFDSPSVSLFPCDIEIVNAMRLLESDIRKERTLLGIEKAKSRGVFTGRKKGCIKAGVDLKAIADLHAQGVSKSQIAVKFGLSRDSVRKYLAMK